MNIDAAILTPQRPTHDLRAWLNDILGTGLTLQPLAGDASGRRYFRISSGNRSMIAMDSPPHEKLPQFLAVRDFLAAGGIRVPRLLAAAAARGFALLDDFGDATYLLAVNENNCDELYAAAIGALIKIQIRPPPAGLLANYDAQLLDDEMRLYADWYCAQHVRQPLSQKERDVFVAAADFLTRECLMQLQVFVHRDYHSRNLMAIAEGPGVLDFQDAVVGPATYDMVSLLRDAYIDWPPARQQIWLENYRQRATAAGLALPEAKKFTRNFNITGAQRGLKVLGIFARLARRDNKPAYVTDMPLVYRHLTAAGDAVPELAELMSIVRGRPPCAP